MRNVTRVILAILAVALNISLTSCGSNDKETGRQETEQTDNASSLFADADEGDSNEEKADEKDSYDGVGGNNGELIAMDFAMFNEVAGQESLERPIIIDFGATWCGPCQTMKPTVKKVAKEYAGKIDVYTVDIDEQERLAQKFQVESVPTLIFISTDGETYRMEGALGQSEFEEIISEHFNL